MHLRAKQAYLGEYKTLPVCSVFNVEKRSDQNVRPGKRIRCLGQIVGFSQLMIPCCHGMEQNHSLASKQSDPTEGYLHTWFWVPECHSAF
jgi:hypothetical protein